GRDDGIAGVGVCPGQGRRTSAGLGHTTGPADNSCICHGVRTIEYKAGIINDIANNAACGAAVADLQGASSDGSTPGIGIGAAQRQCTSSDFLQTAAIP